MRCRRRRYARDAHMRVPEIGLGMNMSWQSVPRMLHLMGPAHTKQAVILADQRITAAEAYEWRLAQALDDLAAIWTSTSLRWRACPRITRKASRRSSAAANRGSRAGRMA